MFSDYRKLTGVMMEPVWQGERQLLPGRQMVSRSRVYPAAVTGDPEVIQEVDVLVLFITCQHKTKHFRYYTNSHL